MGYIYNIELSSALFTDLLWYLEKAAKNENDFGILCDIVHAIDYLEEEKIRSSGYESAETKRWFEQEKMFEEGGITDPTKMELFSKITSVLSKYRTDEVIELSPKDEFHLVCDIINKIEEE